MASRSFLLLSSEGMLQLLPGFQVFLSLFFRQALNGKTRMNHHIIADLRVGNKVNTSLLQSVLEEPPGT